MNGIRIKKFIIKIRINMKNEIKLIIIIINSTLIIKYKRRDIRRKSIKIKRIKR